MKLEQFDRSLLALLYVSIVTTIVVNFDLNIFIKMAIYILMYSSALLLMRQISIRSNSE